MRQILFLLFFLIAYKIIMLTVLYKIEMKNFRGQGIQLIMSLKQEFTEIEVILDFQNVL